MSDSQTRSTLGQRLHVGIADLQLTPHINTTQVGQLLAYHALIQKWNKVYNLTALRDPVDMLTHHLLDSLAVVLPLQRQWMVMQNGSGSASGLTLSSTSLPPPCHLLDVGSGAGLPGVVLAICCPWLQVTCVDAVAKKMAFVRQVATELHLPNLQATHSRVEDLTQHFDVIASRAFASLVDFVGVSEHVLQQPQGMWLAMKAKDAETEMAQLPQHVEVFHVEQLQVPQLDAQRCIVWLRWEFEPKK